MGREQPPIRAVDARAELGGLPVLHHRVGEPPRRQRRGPASLLQVADETQVGARSDEVCDLGQDVLDVIAPERRHERGIGEELDPVLRRGAIGQCVCEDRHGAVPLAEAVAGVAQAYRKTEGPVALTHPARKSEALCGRLEDGRRVDLALVDRPIVDASQESRHEAGRSGQPLTGLDDADPFLDATKVPERGPLRDERVGQERHEVGMLGDIECPIGHLDRPPVISGEHARAGQLAMEGGERRVVPEVGELDDCWFEQVDGLGGSASGQVSPSERGDRPCRRHAVLALAIELGRAEEECLRLVMAAGLRGDIAGPLEQFSGLRGIRRDRERLAEEGDRLVVRAERDRPFGSAAEGDPGLPGEGVGFRPLGRVRVRGQVMTGQTAGDLVRVETLEEARRGQMADLAIPLRERVVGDLADERLDEGVLTALGTARVRLEGQELPADEAAQARLEFGLVGPGHRRQSGAG